MNDAELAEKVFAVAGRLLDADTLFGNGGRALEVARTTAEVARRLLREPTDEYRTIAELIIKVEAAADAQALANVVPERSH